MTTLVALALVCLITPSTAVDVEFTRAAYTDEKTRTLTARDQPFENGPPRTAWTDARH